MEKTNENYNMLLVKNNVTIVVYDLGFFQIKNIYLSDTKKNIIMDGKFTKIIYSDELITTHGIFLKIPFHNINQCALRLHNGLASSVPYSFQNHPNTKRSLDLVVEKQSFSDQTPPGAALDFPNSSGDPRSPTELSHCTSQWQSNVGGVNAPRPDRSGGNQQRSYHSGQRGDCDEKLGNLCSGLRPYGSPTSTEVNKTTENMNEQSNSKFKQIYKLQSHDILNSKNITDIIRIEMQILEFYKQLFQCKKKIVFMLKEQLQEGNIKLYKEHFYNFIKFPCKQNYHIPNVILKISGIWETDDNIGLTYKFIEYSLDNSRL
jgi:hypothetical protein